MWRQSCALPGHEARQHRKDRQRAAVCSWQLSDVVFEGGPVSWKRSTLDHCSFSRRKASHQSFTNNNLPWKGLPGGTMLVAGGSALVESSTFTANSAVHSGGAIAVNSSASFKLVASVVEGNSGELRPPCLLLAAVASWPTRCTVVNKQCCMIMRSRCAELQFSACRCHGAYESA